VPAKSSWISRFNESEQRLAGLGIPEVDRAVIEEMLGVGSRRAQQLMSGLPGRTVGNVFLVDRASLLNKLRSIASGESNAFETERRVRFAEKLEGYRRERINHPQLLVEAPTAVVNTRLADLPVGVTVGPGRITVEETDGKRALEKLLALAMAIGNQFDEFDQLLSSR